MYNPYIVYEDHQNVVLSCAIDEANPAAPVTYEWNRTSGIENTQNITIVSINKSHSGQYSCSATNIAGTSAITTKQINVHCKSCIFFYFRQIGVNHVNVMLVLKRKIHT